MFKTFLVLLIVLILAVAGASAIQAVAFWQPVGMAGFSAGWVENPRIALDAAGLPYVAYADGAYSSKATIMRFNGTNWETVGAAGFSAGLAYQPDIALDSSGVPYVAYQDHGNSRKATVMTFDGANWVPVGTAGFSAGTATNLRIALDSSGVPYVAYKDHGNSRKATVMMYNGTGWAPVGAAGFSAGVVAFTNIALDASDTPYVAYADEANSNKATVKKFNGTSWETVGTVGFSGGRVTDVDMALDAAGTPLVAYKDYANSYKATVMTYDGANWVPVGAPGFSAWWASDISLALDSSGAPYVAYADGQTDHGGAFLATVKRFNGTSWETVGTDLFSATEVESTDIALDGNDTPYVAYSETKATVMKFAEADGDGDGWADDADNCADEVNPDQSNIDGDEFGDVCDICPNEATDSCDAAGSAAGYFEADVGGTLTTGDGTVSITLPPGAMMQDGTISITDTDRGVSGFALTSPFGTVLGFGVFSVDLQPPQSFNLPVTITFSWADADDNGWVDGTLARETRLFIVKDDVQITGRCEDELADGSLPDCDMAANTFVFEVTSWSDFALGYSNDPQLTAELSVVTADEGTAAENSGTLSDADGDIVNVAASIGDVSTGGGAWFWSYDAADGPAAETVTILATDSAGGEGRVTFDLRVNNVPPTAVIGDVDPLECARGGVTVTLDGSGSSDPAGALDPLSFTWIGPFPEGEGTVYGVTPTVTLKDFGDHLITLTAADDEGGSSTASATLVVQDTAPPSLKANLVRRRGDDDDGGRYKIRYRARDRCDRNLSVSAVLLVDEYPRPLKVNRRTIVEFEFGDEVKIEKEGRVYEIQAPGLVLEVTAVDDSGNEVTAVAELRRPPDDGDDG